MTEDHRNTERAPARTTVAVALTTLAIAVLPTQPAHGRASVAHHIAADGFESGSHWGWTATLGVTGEPAYCTPPIVPSDTSGATGIVGNGSPASCTEGALDAVLAGGHGQIRFNCGTAPHTITVSGEKEINTTRVIDGGGLVTLSGGGTTRILALRPPGGPPTFPTLTVQNLTLINGYTGNLPSNETNSGGSAIFRASNSTLHVINSVFRNNVGPTTGQDVAGGALYGSGQGDLVVVGSTFVGNRSSSGGAIGGLFSNLTVANSDLSGNAATGTGGNPGSGGNGGAIYLDGNNQVVSICGSRLAGNDAGARGAGVFRVSNNGVGSMTIDRTSVIGNESPDNLDSQAGGLYMQGLQLTITASTIARNVASSVGGVFVATNPGSQTLQISNSTIAENHGRAGLGAGLTVANPITGALSHVTLARNSNQGPTSFASAFAFGSGLTLGNSLIADNTKVFIFEDVSCNVQHAGVGSVQWPATNASNEAETPCAGVTFLDANIGVLGWHGGPTPTIAPAAAAVDASATNCPPTDQRGRPRPATCTPGAVEIP